MEIRDVGDEAFHGSVARQKLTSSSFKKAERSTEVIIYRYEKHIVTERTCVYFLADIRYTTRVSTYNTRHTYWRASSSWRFSAEVCARVLNRKRNEIDKVVARAER